MKSINLANIPEASSGERLPAGGYICEYTNVSDNDSKEYLYMEFDIAEGPYKGWYKKLEERAGFWGGKCYRSYKEKALPMFKRMCSAVAKSNPGFIFDGQTNSDETALIGKKVGIILSEEEYVGNDGSVKTRLNVNMEVPIETIQKGAYKVPPLKKLPQSADTFVSVDDSVPDEVPF